MSKALDKISFVDLLPDSVAEDETIKAYVQFEYQRSRGAAAAYSCIKSGIKYRLTSRCNLSFQSVNELKSNRDSFLQFQIRYRF